MAEAQFGIRQYIWSNFNGRQAGCALNDAMIRTLVRWKSDKRERKPDQNGAFSNADGIQITRERQAIRERIPRMSRRECVFSLIDFD